MLRNRISRGIVFTILAACVLLIVPAPASAQRVFVGFGGPYWGGPYWGPYGWGYPAYAYGPYGYGVRPLGEVRLKSPTADAQIFINGSLAGRAHDLKKFYLAPGTYNLEQRAGSDVQKIKVYVLANRTVKIEFDKPGVPHNPVSAQPPASAEAPAAAPAPLPPPPPPPASAPPQQ
jgi:hypothetical protein